MIDAALTVRRARVHGAVDPATAPSRLAAVLSGGELVPAGLPPAAVLCIRRLGDPAPGLLPLDPGQLRPPAEWERAFVEQLTRLLAAAARPAREAVPADAGAVYFADRAELLACLARDARDGTVWTRWWWRSLAPGAGPRGDPVIEAWRSAPEHVPSALALLAARGEAEAFVAALPLPVVRELAVRVAAAFGATELERAIVRAARPAGTFDPSQRGSAPPRSAVARARRTRAADPPWSAIVPEASAQPLAPARALFLGVALALRRAPALALRPAFAREVDAWFEPALVETPAEPAVVSAPGPPAPEPLAVDEPSVVGTAAPPREQAQLARGAAPLRELAEPSPEPFALRAPAAGVTTSSAPSPAESVTPSEPGEPTRAEPIAVSPLSPTVPVPVQKQRSRPRAHVAPPPPATQRRTRERRPSVAVPQPVPEPETTTDAHEDMPVIGVETELGGVFYLLNLFLYLGLYGDFTSPKKPGIGLDPWECVARVARRLVSRERRSDPVWRILANLAGRHVFRPPRAWRAPRAWLQPFDADGVWRWSAANGMLRVEHPAGFAAVAVPRTTEHPRMQLERELKHLRIRPELKRATLGREPADPLDRWTARLAAYVHARLVLALDLDVEHDLFARRARVFVTESHVDVVLSLSDLPLAVRFAGLDRTPGFVPAAGRFVAFHFE